MIKFTLKCANDHSFESWFGTADAFETLKKSGHVTCAVCGTADVDKSLMAPRVTTGRKKAAEPTPTLTEPQSDVEKAMTQMRDEVEKNSEYVGMNFAKEARAIHDGESPGRAIYGEAKIEEAKSLIEDGVPVAPLPFMPKRKTN